MDLRLHDWSDNPTLEAGAIFSPILLLGKLRLGEVKNLTHEYHSGFELGLSDCKAQGLLDKWVMLSCCTGPSCPMEGCLLLQGCLLISQGVSVEDPALGKLMLVTSAN